MPKTVDLKRNRPKFASTQTREMYYAAKAAIDEAAKKYASRVKQAQAAREQLIKKAEFGVNQNPAFEKAFGSVAFTYLQEKVPGLVPYIVGFQLLDRDEHGRKAIGVFVAELGERIIDIPMFFINGELKGHQLMRLRKPDMFIPLREAFIDYLLSKLPQDLGENGPGMNELSPLRSSPEVSPFNASRLMKNSEELHHIHDWALDHGVLEAYGGMRTNKLSLELGVSLLNKKGEACFLDLQKEIAKSETLLKTAARLADQYPIFRQRMEGRYGADWLRKSAELYKEAQARKLKLRLPSGPSQFKLGSAGINSQTKELEYRVHPNLRKSSLKLDKAASSDLLDELAKYGEEVIDRRDLSKLAESYRVLRSDFTLEAPIDPGIYTVFLHDGTSRPIVVIPAKNRLPHSKYDLLFDKGKKLISLASRNAYICRQSTDDEGGPVFDVQKALGAGNRKPKENELFLVVSHKGEVAGPYRVTEKHGRNVYDVEDCSNDYHFTFSEGVDEIPAYAASASVNTVAFESDRNNSELSKVRDQLLVGKNAKTVILGKVEPDDEDSYYIPREQWERLSFKPMSQELISFDNLEKFANLEVIHQHERVSINGVQMQHGHARRYLLEQCHLSKVAADQILTPHRPVERFIVSRPGESVSLLTFQKRANRLPAPNTPPWPPEEQPYSSESGRYMIQEPQMEMTESDPAPRREPMRPWEDPHDQMFLDGGPSGINSQEMGTSPDELFDVMGLVSLVRNSRIDSSIRETTKSLLQSIDHLGRMLFMFYTHNDEFEARYGENDMQDLESALISVFEGAGDLFITLSRRANEPQPELDMMNLPMDM